MKKIAVGMSGGVDSSVAALLLKKQGFDVFGLFMKNWQDDSSDCSSKKDFEDVQRVCEKIDIPYYTINFEKEYFENVFQKCLTDFENGITPNPDVLCNKEIKFNLFLKKALMLGADFLATGHYSQNKIIDKKNHLLKSDDLSKDQSYFLYTLKSTILEKVIFPIGHLKKNEVRKIAKENNLPTFDKKDSTGICFIGERKFTDFLMNFIQTKPGHIKSIETQENLGKHIGLSFYTIGQRKGLKIGGRGDAWFVVDKNIKDNILYVSQGEKSSYLYKNNLTAKNLSWVDESFKINLPFKCSAKIRYRQNDQPCTIEKIEEGNVFVSFDSHQRAITKGQAIVFYIDSVCLGGAEII